MHEIIKSIISGTILDPPVSSVFDSTNLPIHLFTIFKPLESPIRNSFTKHIIFFRMPFQYKTVLVIGATSGIGLALSEKLIENGCYVIAVGRRQQNLDSLVQKHGKGKVSSFQFDITNLSAIPEFVKS
jgi:NADPH:quinone reductase-like Zn-dependent oxidoreductase